MCNLKIKFLLSELFYLHLQGGLAKGSKRGMSVQGCWKHSLMPKEHRHVLESGQCLLKTKALRKRGCAGRIGCSRPLNTEPFGLITMIAMSRELSSITSLGQLPISLARVPGYRTCPSPVGPNIRKHLPWSTESLTLPSTRAGTQNLVPGDKVVGDL